MNVNSLRWCFDNDALLSLSLLSAPSVWVCTSYGLFFCVLLLLLFIFYTRTLRSNMTSFQWIYWSPVVRMGMPTFCGYNALENVHFHILSPSFPPSLSSIRFYCKTFLFDFTVFVFCQFFAAAVDFSPSNSYLSTHFYLCHLALCRRCCLCSITVKIAERFPKTVQFIKVTTERTTCDFTHKCALQFLRTQFQWTTTQWFRSRDNDCDGQRCQYTVEHVIWSSMQYVLHSQSVVSFVVHTLSIWFFSFPFLFFFLCLCIDRYTRCPLSQTLTHVMTVFVLFICSVDDIWP